MIRASKLGTIVHLPDGRIGTTVYNGLDGVGIKWGRHWPDPRDFEGTSGGLLNDKPRLHPWPWYPDAMLRNPYPGADVECVGEDFEIEYPEAR